MGQLVKITSFEGEGNYLTPDELGYDPELYWQIGEIVEIPERVFNESKEEEGDGYDIYKIHQIELNPDGTGVAKMIYQHSTPF